MKLSPPLLILLLCAPIVRPASARAQDQGGPIEAAEEGEALAPASEPEEDTYTEEELSADQSAAPIPVGSGSAPLGASAPSSPAAAAAAPAPPPAARAKPKAVRKKAPAAVVAKGPALAPARKKAAEQPAVPLTPVAPSNP